MANNYPVSPVNGQPVPENGKPFTTSDERARQAGKISGQRRKERKTLKEELLALLSEERTDKNGKKTKIQKAVSAALIKSALEGSVKAFVAIRDTIGEMPVENVAITSGSVEALNEAFEALKGEDAK